MRSVVTRDIPAGVLAVGNPCRVFREVGQCRLVEIILTATSEDLSRAWRTFCGDYPDVRVHDGSIFLHRCSPPRTWAEASARHQELSGGRPRRLQSEVD